MKKVIAYLRVSTGTQNEERQSELIEKHCSTMNYEIVDTIKEERMSGSLKDRTGLNKLKQLTKDDCDMVIISETSRLSREDRLISLVNNIQILLDENIDVYFLNNNRLLKGGQELSIEECIILLVEAKANSDERKKIVERCLSGRISKVKQGCYGGHKVAYGFKIIPNKLRVGSSKEFGKSLLVIDEDKRQTVELIFDLIANKGYTIRSSSKYLNDLGIDKSIENWTFFLIKSIIHNSLYCGLYTFGGETIETPEIITKELFDKAQIKLKSNQLFVNKGNVNYNILKGLAKCPCGSSLMITKRGTGNTYYNCTKKQGNYQICNCTNVGINASNLNNIVWKVTKAFLNKTDFALKTEQAGKGIDIEIQHLENKINNQSEELTVIDKKIESTLDLLINSTDEQRRIIKRKFDELVNNQTELKEVIKSLNIELTKLLTKRKDFNTYEESELMENLTDIEKNTIYKKFISEVVYYSVTKYKGFIVITFKNGFKSILSYTNRVNLSVYELPQSFNFNPLTRKVIGPFYDTSNISETNFEFPTAYTKELTYEEITKDKSFTTVLIKEPIEI